MLPEPRYLLLDGATGTNLYVMGMPQGVCVEEYILSHKEQIKRLQAEFIAAGSDVIYAPTFSANREKLKFFGLQDKVREFNIQLVGLAKSIAGDKLVAGDISPTGLFIEPYGDTTFLELIDIYQEQVDALYEAGVDLFVIETMLSLSEARAAVIACKKYDKPIYVTFTINERGKTMGGSDAITCLTALQGLSIDAFGLNCSFGPEKLVEPIKELRNATIPIIAKPNAGQPNPLLPNVYDLSPVMMKEEMRALLNAGAKIIGGCCGTTPAHVAAMRELLDSYVLSETVEQVAFESDILLCNERQVFALDHDRIEFTEAIKCEYDMADHFVDAEEESFDVLLIEIHTEDDAKQFALNAHIATLPVCFHATSEIALERALLLYQGRCMVDSVSPIDAEMLKTLATKYGAIVY